MADLRHLEHFVAVVESGGFRAASVRVHLSAPALTRSVQVLEAAYGTRLLDRKPDRVRPTPAGEIVLAEARHLLGRHRLIGIRLKALEDLAVGQLNVGASPVVADLYLGEAIGRLQREHPGLSVDVRIEPAGALVPDLLSHRIDLVIALRAPLERESDLAVASLYQDCESWWVRRGHPLAGRGDVTAEEVLTFPIAFQHLPPTMERFFDEVFRETARPVAGGGSGPASGCQCDTYDLLFRVAASSDSIAAVPLRNGRRAASAHGLVRLDFRSSERWEFDFATARRRDETPPPAVARFAEILRAIVEADDEASAPA